MGPGKNRSSSIGNAPPPPPSSSSLPPPHSLLTANTNNNNKQTSTTTIISSSSQRHQHQLENLSAANTLINHFIHQGHCVNNVHNNTTVAGTFHRIITTAATASSSSSSPVSSDHEDSNSDSKLEALYLLEGLFTRLAELDNANSNSHNTNSQVTNSHGQLLVTTQNVESGYNALHIAILHRDLMCILLLLGHASSNSNNDDAINLMKSNGSSTSGMGMGMMHHPLQLLNYNDNNINIGGATTTTTESKSLLTVLTSTTDNEKLTPIQLLGKMSISGLKKCRETLRWYVGCSEGSSRRHQQRQRGLSFGNSSNDSSSINDDGGAEEEEEDDDEMNNGNRRRRIRSDSFNILQDDDGGGANDYDLRPLDDNVDYSVLAGRNNNTEQRGDVNNDGLNQYSTDQQQHQQAATSTEDEYGCEVLTFGRADHYALGVPQFTTTSSRGGGGDYNNNKGGGHDDKKLLSSSSSSTTSYKPKRVETFALGELRRSWSSSSSASSSSSCCCTVKQDSTTGIVDSPAVSIAASTHHTLVATRSGQLFSFGYGKGGRLGTGDENHRPLPTRILGPLTTRIVASIAAATNHSLCSTADGKLYAWGSNGFGQLGYSTSSSSSSGDLSSNNSSRLLPRRVEGELKQLFVVAVAAGDRHSVAMTKEGQVYCWGDNKSGQLGLYNGTTSSPSPSSSQMNCRCNPRPQLVEGLWSAQPRRRAIAIAASEFSTLVLTSPPSVFSSYESSRSSIATLPVNAVYQFGHGNHNVMKVIFPTDWGNNNSLGTSRRNNDVYSRSRCLNPIAISSAKYHNVAITSDGGLVYTWGLHSDSLGIDKSSATATTTLKKDVNEWVTASEDKRRPRSNSLQGSSTSSSSSSIISSPRLVVGMLPENGGGNAVAVSASESHTAIVTEDGHLYTWGASDGKDVMGHQGTSYQPSPRKVGRVHRAVGVAAAKEHTVLLMATTFPPILSTNTYSAIDNDGYRQPLSLQEHAAIEIKRNMDQYNVLPISNVARRLNCKPLISFTDEFIQKNLDGVLAVGNKNDYTKFLSFGRIALAGGMTSYDRDGPYHPFLYQLINNKNWVEGSRHLLKQYSASIVPRTKKRMIAKNRPKKEDRQSSTISLKEPGVTVEGNVTPSTVKRKKKPAKVSVVEETAHAPRKLFDEKPTPREKATSKYHCKACNMSCPDNASYTLHMNGRKHRNRLAHARAEEEKQVALNMMAMKRMQLMERRNSIGHSNDAAAVLSDHKTTKGKLAPEAKKSSIWAAPKTPDNTAATPSAKQKIVKPLSGRKARSKSFQDILIEEQQQKKKPSNSTVMFSSPIAAKQPSVLRKNDASQVYPMKMSSQSSSPVTSPRSSITLSAFMKKECGNEQANPMSGIGASWGSKPAATAKTNKNCGVRWGKTQPSKAPAQPQTTSMKSFSEIQLEEESFRSNEDQMCRIDGKWFVQKRERAASIGEIAEQEKIDAEIEAQRQIELAEEKQLAEAIARSLEEQKPQKSSRRKNNRPQGRQKQTKKKSSSGSNNHNR